MLSNPGNGSSFIRYFAAALALAACAPARPPAPAPEPVRPEAPVTAGLPQIPLETGPLAISVVYPRPNQTIASRDSTFVFGSLGNGNASLTVNGVPAPVWPNGAFMVFLPVPPRSNPVFELLATTGSETARLSLPVQLPPEPVPPDTAAPPVVAVDTVSNRWATVLAPQAPDTNRIIWGPAVPDPDTTRFFVLPGTLVRVVSPAGTRLRVALDESQQMTIAAADLAIQPADFAPPPRSVGSPVVTSQPGFAEVAIPASGPPPYYFWSEGRVLRLTLYGAIAAASDTGGMLQTLAVEDSLLQNVQHAYAGDRALYSFALARDVYGYSATWQDGNFVIRIRRPPVVDSAAPLRGLTIAVDPGHPGLPGEAGGATGPTGLREPDAVLAVGLRLREMLLEKGAVPFLTRSTPDPVALNSRAAMAARADAHAYVSIHLNAVPDNVNPFRAQGTSTYYWFPHSRRLAETTHEALLRHMHLRDIGVMRENFALVRNPWMPSVLTEGAFIIMPDQEYALRTPEYQSAYARAILEGLEAYFREIASGR